MEWLFEFGLQGLIAFGAVGIINRVLVHFTSIKLTGDARIFLLVLIAFGVGYIPADLGSVLFERIREAVIIALGVHALWTVRKGV